MPRDEKSFQDLLASLLQGPAPLDLDLDLLADEPDPKRQEILRELLSLRQRQHDLEAHSRQVDAELRRSNWFLDSIVENLPNMVFVKDAADLRFVRLNRAAEVLLGYDRTETLGKNDYDLFPKAEADFFTRHDREVLEGKKLVDIPEEPIHTRTQGTRLLHTKKIPILDDEGVPRYLLGLSEDVTERQLAEQELQTAKAAAETANKARSAFLAQMSHEIRTPIAGIIGLTQSLLGSSPSEAQRERLRLVGLAADSLLRIIDDILIFSRLEAGRMSLRIEPFDVVASVNSRAGLMRFEAEEKGLDFATVIAPSIPLVVMGDADRLGQVLSNLFGNALKFTESGSITLGLRPVALTSQEVVLHFSVKDTGIGIKEEHLATIFEAFSQVDEPLTRRAGGSGLGLSICAHIVELMGGRIWVESTPGQGTTVHFTARFGLSIGGEKSTAFALSPEPHPTVHSGLRVLVAEDDEVNRQAVTDLLERLGHTADCVSDGGAAVKAVLGERYDFVLMDIRLRDMDGVEATRRIRKLEPEVRRTPIAALTAYVTAADRERCFNAGMNAYLEKPIQADDLERVFSRFALSIGGFGSPDPGNEVFGDAEGNKWPEEDPDGRGPRPGDSPVDASPVERPPIGTVPDARRGILEVFLDTVPSHLEKLQTAVNTPDLEAALDAAHLIAGAAANVGAKHAAEIARDIESAARRGDREEIRERCQALLHALAAQFPSLRSGGDS